MRKKRESRRVGRYRTTSFTISICFPSPFMPPWSETCWSVGRYRVARLKCSGAERSLQIAQISLAFLVHFKRPWSISMRVRKQKVNTSLPHSLSQVINQHSSSSAVWKYKIFFSASPPTFQEISQKMKATATAFLRTMDFPSFKTVGFAIEYGDQQEEGCIAVTVWDREALEHIRYLQHL